MSTSQEDKVVAWIEREIGGRVSACRSQGRWRDAWFVTLEKDGKPLELYVRGDRNEEFSARDRIEYEASVFTLLGEGGIPVPKVYGICPDPHAIVMECSPGRANLKTAESEEERVSVLEHLGEIMADMHALDIAPFVAAGAQMPQSDREKTQPYAMSCEATYRRLVKDADPRVEFLLRWLERHQPAPPETLAMVAQDAGQFLFDKGQVTVLLDMELARITDPMIDIAALRPRALAEPMGDLRPLLRRYVERTGRPLDRQRISFLTASWQAGVCATIVYSLRSPKPVTNYPEYLSWYLNCMALALQAIAEYDRYELEHEKVAPVREPSRYAVGIELLRSRVGRDGREDIDYDRQLNDSTSRFVDNIDSMGDWSEAGYIADVAALTGTRPGGWREADEAFGRFAEQAGPEHDRPIVEMLHRWVHRQLRLIEGLYAFPFSKMTPIDELLDL